MTSLKPLRIKRQYLRDQNRQYTAKLEQIPRERWPAEPIGSPERLAIWRSKDFLVQIFAEKYAAARISVNRTQLDSTGRWKDGISWEELMQIKAECGYGEQTAVELYPANGDAVNVANIRHLFVIPKPLYAW